MNGKKVLGIILASVVLLAVIIAGAISLLSKPTYKIIFNTNGGTTIKIKEVKAGDKIDKPVNPTKEGYTFDNWYLEDELFDFDTKIMKDITLEAKWIKKIVKYTITFDTLGGNKIDDMEVEEGTILNTLPDAFKEGYTFKGWYYQNKRFDGTEAILQDITLVAKWEKKILSTKENSYTVTFDTDGASNINSQRISSGKLVLMPQNPTKEGYTFKGWYLNGTLFDFNTKITKNITLVAKWEKNEDANLTESKISYILESDSASVVGQAILYITLNGEKVDGTLDITSKSGKTKTIEVLKEGYKIQKDIIASISNIKLK